MLPELYDFQVHSLDRVRDRFRDGKRRVVLSSPTGSGKTVMAATMLRNARAGRRALFVTDLITLTGQATERFEEYGIPHGVMQGANTRDLDAPVIIATPQTIRSRGLPPGIRIAVVDECHTIHRALMRELRESDPDLYLVGLSGTPLTEGLGDYYDAIAPGVPTYDLIDQGHLVDLRTFVGVTADMRGAPTNDRGEWRSSAVAQRGMTVVGEVVGWWERKTAEVFGDSRRARTLVFAATIEHGRRLTQQFRERGHDFRHVYDAMPRREREEALDGFRAGRVAGLVSVGVLSKGFDVAEVNCLVLTRHFRRSLSEHLQQLGRGMRKAVGKRFCLVLDYTGNMVRHSARMEHFYTHGLKRLRKAGEPEEEVDERPTLSECKRCGLVKTAGRPCPECGTRGRQPTQVPGRLVEWRTRRSLADDALARHGAQELFDGCMTLALAHYGIRPGSNDQERALPMARARYHSLTGQWPPRGASFRGRRVIDELSRWWQRENDYYRQLKQSEESGGTRPATPSPSRPERAGQEPLTPRALRWRP